MFYISESLEIYFGGEHARLIRINPVAALKIQALLSSDEKLHWADMPNPKVIFHSDDWSAVPFSLLWTGFFVFWEWEALQQYRHSAGQGWFMVFWGIPFLVMGNYMVWGRFIVDAWLKRRTFYAVTSRRVLVLQERWHPKSASLISSPSL